MCILFSFISGFTAGGKAGDGRDLDAVIDAPGGGSNYLCLPHQPTFNNSIPEEQDTRSRIFGAEYRSNDPGALNPYHVHDAPCVMCQSRDGRTQSFMMPATTHCPIGWTREYHGYLTAARWNHPRTEYICLDSNPDVIPATERKETLSLLFHVEVISSDGLPDAYVTGNDLTCAICTM